MAEPFYFPRYNRPRSEGPIDNLPHDRAGESNDGELPAENLGDLLGRVSKNSTSEIDSLIGEFERLRGKLQTDGERIQHEVEEYKTLSERVMELTKTISGSVEKVRTLVDQ
jgi:hypothetical protein